MRGTSPRMTVVMETRLQAELQTFLRVSRRRGELAVEGKPLLAGGDHNLFAVLDQAGEDHLGERILPLLLDDPLERTRPIGGVVALFGNPLARLAVEFDRDLAIIE